MQTSNYARSANDHNAVSIAGRAPEWFKGREYKKLAPKYWFFKKYKEDSDEDYYTERFIEEVLGELDAKKVYEELGCDAIMLCWESPGKFCHRRIVAKWLEEELGIEINEKADKSEKG